ncbi:MAG: FecR domain-containing protein [Bacteroidales bacterium]
MEYNIDDLLRKLTERRCSKEELDFLANYLKTGSLPDIEGLSDMQDLTREELESVKSDVWKEISERIKKESLVRSAFKFGFRQAMKYAAMLVGIVAVSALTLYLFQEDDSHEIKLLTDGKEVAVTISNVKDLAKMGIGFKDGILVYNNQIEAFEHAVQVPAGKKIEVLLADGSKVWLNSGSKLNLSSGFLKYPDNHPGKSMQNGLKKEVEGVRELILDGEAYFDVVSNGNDFIVYAREMTTRVLGTKFVVTSYKNMNRVVLEDGSVKVEKYNDKGVSAYLNPGEMATFINGRGDIDIEKVDASNYSLWRDGVIMFNNERFEDILMTLEREFDVIIENRNQALLQSTFTGRFSKDSIETILSMFELTNNISYSINQNNITIHE